MAGLTTQAAGSWAQLPAWPQINQLCLTGHLTGMQGVEWPAGCRDGMEKMESWRTAGQWRRMSLEASKSALARDDCYRLQMWRSVWGQLLSTKGIWSTVSCSFWFLSNLISSFFERKGSSSWFLWKLVCNGDSHLSGELSFSILLLLCVCVRCTFWSLAVTVFYADGLGGELEFRSSAPFLLGGWSLLAKRHLIDENLCEGLRSWERPASRAGKNLSDNLTWILSLDMRETSCIFVGESEPPVRASDFHFTLSAIFIPSI